MGRPRVVAVAAVVTLALLALGWHLLARPAGPAAWAWEAPAASETGLAQPRGAEGRAAGAAGGTAAQGERGAATAGAGIALAGAGGSPSEAASEARRGASEAGPVYAPYRGGRAAGWVVDVEGAVARPGVYVLPEGSRVWDAIAAAGGTAPNADREGLNLAAALADGAYVYVPRKGEAPPASAAGRPGGGAVGGASGAGGPARVDLNRAGAAELEGLPGIGPKLAERIVAERAAHGPFSSLDDLAARVPGIGPKSVARIRPYVLLR